MRSHAAATPGNVSPGSERPGSDHGSALALFAVGYQIGNDVAEAEDK